MYRNKLVELAIENARKTVAAGDSAKAMDWLKVVPPDEIPKDLHREIMYASAKAALSTRNWGKAIDHLGAACSKGNDPLIQRRLGLARKRKPLLEDKQWDVIRSAIDPPTRLRNNQLRPEVERVWACGAYYSRGSHRGAPWSEFLRMNKKPHELDPEVREAALHLSSAYLCRFIHDMTDILGDVDVVVAIPPNPYRYINRGWSLPDRLAKAIEQHLAVPYEPYALELIDTDLELRGLSSSERRRCIRGAMCVDKIGLAKGCTVLVVDDVITSGATMQEAARHLINNGVPHVYAIALSHTEG